MADDVSRNVVAILLVLVILVSALGTWVFLYSFDNISRPTEDSTSGDVMLQIKGQPSAPTGNVILKVETPEAS